MNGNTIQLRKRTVKSSKETAAIEKKRKKCVENNSEVLGADSKELEPDAGPLESCSICMSEMEEEFIGSPNNCSHHFCIQCLGNWSIYQELETTCPICRAVYSRIQVLDRRTEKCVSEKPVPHKVLKIQHPTSSYVTRRAIQSNGVRVVVVRAVRRP